MAHLNNLNASRTEYANVKRGLFAQVPPEILQRGASPAGPQGPTNEDMAREQALRFLSPRPRQREWGNIGPSGPSNPGTTL